MKVETRYEVDGEEGFIVVKRVFAAPKDDKFVYGVGVDEEYTVFFDRAGIQALIKDLRAVQEA